MKTRYRVINFGWSVEVQVKYWFWPFWLSHSDEHCFYKLKVNPQERVVEFDDLGQTENWVQAIKRNYYPEINRFSP